MRYPAAFLEQLKRSISVSSVIGARIAVRRHGREFQALCPFHKEKTPSFTINDAKGFYHCFGCGAHGDVIGFIKEYEGISYKEAIEKLANEAGLPLPELTKEAVAQARRERDLQEIHELACQWFEAQLAGDSGYAARSYLAQRGLNDASIRQFRLGYAPEDRLALANGLEASGVREAELVAAGLLIQPDDTGRKAYSRFRGRIMFPIRDARSQVVAFGGRIMTPAENAPKYLNSPETELFHKGTMLYNYDVARRALKEGMPLLVCEGYMDVIALAQAGIETAVAPLGTAITAAQLKQLWSLADEPLMCLDGDAAGQRAMMRAAEVALPLLAPAKSLRFMTLPLGEDPDSLVRREGRQAFLARTQHAVPLVEQLCSQMMAQPATTPEARAGQEQALYALADSIAHSGVKAHYREHIRRLFWQKGQAKQQRAPHQAARGASQSTMPPVLSDVSSRKIQALLRGFALLLHFESLAASSEAEWFLCELEMPDVALSHLQRLCLSTLEGGVDLHSLLANVPAPLQRRLEQELALLQQQKSEDIRQPQRLWSHMLTSYRHACLLEDYAQAEREMAQAMTPDRFARFAALKAELEQIEQAYQHFQQEQHFAEG